MVSSAQIGTAIAHIVHTCRQIGTRKVAAVAVATVPPNPGMTRTASKNAGEPTGKRFTQAGKRCRYSCRLNIVEACWLIQYPRSAAKIRPSVSTSVPSTGPKMAPFMIAKASVTENGADATSAKIATASG